ncbi:MAG: DUF2917 domain-containing protein [Chloroflexi bacterium]|nr:DUF2917 domain-containing protein [Chloroflexota bacterium]
MTTTLNLNGNIEIQLHPHNVLPVIENQSGTTVVCENGILWLTQPDDMKDYMLESGEQMILGTHGKVVIEAMSETTLMIISPN